MQNLKNRSLRLFVQSNRNDRRATLLFRTVFVISGTAMTYLLSLRGSAQMITIGALVSCVILCFLTYKFNLLEKVFGTTNKAQLIVAGVFSLFAVYQFVIGFYEKFFSSIENSESVVAISEAHQCNTDKLFAAAVGLVALLAIFVFMYAFISRFCTVCENIFADTDKIDKQYVIIAGATFAIAVIFIFSMTNAFYGANIDGEIINYDVIYTTDSANQVATNVYLNINAPENDIRQPLFGLFAMPFAICATIIAKILFFVPNIYPIAINIIQIILLLVCFVMIVNIIKVDKITKILLLTLLTVAYPSLLYSFNMEQYIFALFWLIMLIYANLLKKENKDYFFIAATGSMLTTGIMFPLLSNAKNIKNYIKDIFNAAIKFGVIICLFGQMPLVVNAAASISSLMRFAGTKLGMSDKILQFFNFVASCFIKPAAGVNETAYPYVSYRLESITTLNYLGVALLFLAIIGFALNRKNRVAQISFGWVSFSFLILCVIGWGTLENGLILYALYFGWAYMTLLALLVEKLFARFKLARYSIYCLCVVALLYINLPAMYELIEFGIKYYPVR